MEENNQSNIKRAKFIKYDYLTLGILILFGTLTIGLPFFYNLSFPPEDSRLSEEVLRTMGFYGQLGLIICWILALIGLIITMYGLFNRRITPKITEREPIVLSSVIKELKNDRNFTLLFVTTIAFALLWLFNLLTFPPGGPLYFLRETTLSHNFPDIPKEELYTYSTYGLFAVVQDTAILAMFIYVIIVKIRPGDQLFENFVNYALKKRLFLSVLLVASLFHAIGHLPFELYGAGQWGTGYSSLESWIAFDKISHAITSIAITMLLVAAITDQFAKMGVENSTGNSIFALLVAIAFMVTIGLVWEIYEWIMNAMLNLGHFIDEILDAPKDLVWDAIGAIIGSILSYFELEKEKSS